LSARELLSILFMDHSRDVTSATRLALPATNNEERETPGWLSV